MTCEQCGTHLTCEVECMCETCDQTLCGWCADEHRREEHVVIRVKD